MYVYELSFEIDKELCRLLDNNDDWKELAGIHMKYSPFDVNEIEQESRRQVCSPTHLLLVKWGQQNHRVEELFVLLYRMRHVPAMRCLVSSVEARFQRLLKKYDVSHNHNINTAPIEENAKEDHSESSLPLPVMLMEKGVKLPTSSKVLIVPSSESTTDNNNTSSTNGNGVDDDYIKNVSAIPVLRYEDLRDATNNWDEANLLGKGGFGQVFKGEWKLLPIAVKRLKDINGKNKELIREMCLNQYRHDNILPLYGYSLGGAEACLVYQLMSGGSLEQRLKCKTHHPPLRWCQRYRIAHGVASGLQYLHRMTGTPLIHGDIKPANILLDQCTMPKIGDFGLARKGPYGEDRSHLKVTKPQGTRPYLPDEYLRSHCLSPAVDVFSFGVVLAETASAQPAYSTQRSPQLLSDFLQVKAHDGLDFAVLEDPILKGSPDSNAELCRKILMIAVHCTKYSRRERPNMLEVYQTLDAMDFQGKSCLEFVPMK